jgi:plasmid stability protein
MASLVIRNMEERLEARLRAQAADHGRSMEEEAQDILRTALVEKPSQPLNLAETIRRRLAPLGGFELPEPDRQVLREPPGFQE